MTPEQNIPLPAMGSQVLTACGTPIPFEAGTPRALNGREWIFFCLTACQKDFERDARNSCLPADRGIGKV